nr:hypothetical protein [Gimesia aquarii]
MADRTRSACGCRDHRNGDWGCGFRAGHTQTTLAPASVGRPDLRCRGRHIRRSGAPTGIHCDWRCLRYHRFSATQWCVAGDSGRHLPAGPTARHRKASCLGGAELRCHLRKHDAPPPDRIADGSA